jgi:hypothetical protein
LVLSFLAISEWVVVLPTGDVSFLRTVDYKHASWNRPVHYILARSK